MNIDQDSVIWDCNCGQQETLVKGLENNGYRRIVKSDCKQFDHLDFKFDLLSEEPFPHCDVIVTRPSAKCQKQTLQKLFANGKPFALLLPMSIITTNYAKKLFQLYRGTVVIPIAKKVHFVQEKKRAINFDDMAWFVGNLINRDVSHSVVIDFFERPLQSRDKFITDDEQNEDDGSDNDDDLLLGDESVAEDEPVQEDLL